MKAEQLDDQRVRIDGKIFDFEMEIVDLLKLEDRVIILFENYEWPDEDPNLGRNVFAYGQNGEQLWRIEDAEVMIGGHTVEHEVSTGYTVLQQKEDGTIHAWAMDWRHDLDPETGKISNPKYFR